MSISIKKFECTGCEACLQVCPQACISMDMDKEGFRYPSVNVDKCINCNLCEVICPAKKNYIQHVPQYTYASYAEHPNIRRNSSSGGIFYILAESVISQGGVVFGAQYDDSSQVVISSTESIEGVFAFMGSKYVQASVDDSYQRCLNYLKEGRTVLFSGTPCLIAGLKSFLRKDYGRLFTVEVVCHGVPSPKVWSSYLDEKFGRERSIKVDMRDKSNGWKKYNFTVSESKAGGDILESSYHRSNEYMRAFLNNMILRPSCYSCIYKGLCSGADVTLGDLWGSESVLPKFDDDQGLSLVVVNSEKGEKLIGMGNGMIKQQVSYETVILQNPAIVFSSKPWPRRSAFFRAYEKNPSQVVHFLQRYMKPTFFMSMRKLFAGASAKMLRLFK